MTPAARSSAGGLSSRWLDGAAVVVTLLGLLARCASWRSVFTDVGAMPLGADPYYHLRRAALLLESFPRPVLQDPALSFPWGASLPWPPGFDLLIALPGLLGASPAWRELWGLWLPALLGAAAVGLVYLLGRALFDRPTGLVAAILLAFMYSAIDASLLGRVDHHSLVAPLTLLQLLLTALALVEHRARRARWLALAAAGAVALAAASWPITPPLYFVPIPATLLLLRATRYADRARPLVFPLLGGSAVLVGASLPLTADLVRQPIALYQPSLFLLLPYLLAALVVGALYLPRRRALALLLVCLPLLAIAGTWFWPPLREAIVVASADDASYLFALESRSPLFVKDRFTLEPLVRGTTALVLLSPLLCVLLLRQLARGGLNHPGRLLLACHAPLGLVLLLLQGRFGEYAAPALALLYAWAIVGGLAQLRQRTTAQLGPWRRRFWLVATVSALGATYLPQLGLLASLAAHDFSSQQRALRRLLDGCAGHLTPPRDPGGQPTAGVLSGWLDAHATLYFTGRPVMVSSFASPSARRANQVAFAAWLDPDTRRTAARLHDLGLRYALVSSVIGNITPMAAVAGLEPTLYERVEVDAQGAVRFSYSAAFFASLHSRLHFADGAQREVNGLLLAPAPNFRLICESDEQIASLGQVVPRLKLFEVVPGAHLVGQARAGAPVELTLELEASSGRRWTFRQAAVTDAEGRFELVVPYPSAAVTGETRAPGRYRLAVDGHEVLVDVTEEAIQRSLRVPVAPWLADEAAAR